MNRTPIKLGPSKIGIDKQSEGNKTKYLNPKSGNFILPKSFTDAFGFDPESGTVKNPEKKSYKPI